MKFVESTFGFQKWIFKFNFDILILAFFQKLGEFFLIICGLCYKQITIINDDSIIVNNRLESLTDDTRVIIYDRNLFIIQATGFTASTVLVQ
jgi:hypothetical protein